MQTFKQTLNIEVPSGIFVFPIPIFNDDGALVNVDSVMYHIFPDAVKIEQNKHLFGERFFMPFLSVSYNTTHIKPTMISGVSITDPLNQCRDRATDLIRKLESGLVGGIIEMTGSSKAPLLWIAPAYCGDANVAIAYLQTLRDTIEIYPNRWNIKRYGAEQEEWEVQNQSHYE